MKKYRQGDILIEEIKKEKIPSNLIEQKNNIIKKGENNHKLINGKILTNLREIYIIIKKEGGKIVHKEHKPINLPKGYYLVRHQREYVSKDEVNIIED